MIIKSSQTNIIVPNVELIAREMTDTSQVGIMIRRLSQLKVRAWGKLVLNNIKFTPRVLRKDFATGIKILTELEILKFNGEKNLHFVLHSQMVDMAVALNNKRLLQYFFGLAQSYRFQPGLKTFNPERLVMMLADMNNIPHDLLIYTRFAPKSAMAQYARHSPLLFVQSIKEG